MTPQSPLRPRLSRSRCNAALVLALACSASGIALGNWAAAPLTVHEWGVNTFDWNAGDRLAQDLPAFLYTDQNPGKLVAPTEPPVRTLPADNGVRTKPILYFYPQRDRLFGRTPGPAQVGIELRFAYGHANAWWPQVSEYRSDPATRGERMELVWDHLAISETIPEGLALPGADLPADHWVRIAREVDAHYVSNGAETERYVFYEGKTREEPVIALLPADGGEEWSFLPRERNPVKEVAVVNIGKHPIYDVIAIYRDRAKGVRWTGHVSVLPAPSPTDPIDQTIALRVPDFSMPQAEDDLKLAAEEFNRRTRDRLIENLTSGYHFEPGGFGFMTRNPADPQPATHLHQLYNKEAVALEKIWHDDFFEAEGLTVLYRESPAYLDEAMPLRIFTSMFFYVKLSRCGLVLNRNLPLAQVHETDRALKQFQTAQLNATEAEELARIEAALKKNRFLTTGQARFLFGRGAAAGWQKAALDKVEGFFE